MAGTTEGAKKTSEAGRGNPHKASPIAVETYIKGIDFPAEKDELIEQATANAAPEDVLHVLNHLGEKTYHSPIEVANAVGNAA